MHSQFSDDFNSGSDAQLASEILGRCVHCGFCNATCPTYQLQGDELDGPRGRIYLIKQLLEGAPVTEQTQMHLDRCLSCRSCETTCPSGVKFGKLADIGRGLIDRKVPRPWPEHWLRRALLEILPYPKRFARLVRFGRLMRPLLPGALKTKVPLERSCPAWPHARHPRRVLILDGCVQQSLAAHINASSAVVLDRLGISAVRQPLAGCCGAMHYHLADHAGGLALMRRTIDVCQPLLDTGVEAIISTASGCGSILKEYGYFLANDPLYAEKAARFSAHCRDLSEVLGGEDLSRLSITPRKIAFHSPCSLQHAQRLDGAIESLLGTLGFSLTPVTDAHLCCGSAGTYSILQPKLAQQLRANKLRHLQTGDPALIATANIGCLLYLQEQSKAPVKHWIELLAPACA